VDAAFIIKQYSCLRLISISLEEGLNYILNSEILPVNTFCLSESEVSLHDGLSHLGLLFLLLVLGLDFTRNNLRNLKSEQPAVDGQQDQDPVVPVGSVRHTPAFGGGVPREAATHSISNLFQ